MDLGGVPSRAGQFCRTRSWLAPIPPEVTITTGAWSSNSPTSVRELGLPREALLGSRIAPRTPVTAPPVVTMPSTRWRNLKVTLPSATPARTFFSNGSTTAGPVPQVTWKRGTELPGPSASPPPRSAQPTIGNHCTPSPASQDRFSPDAKSTYDSAHL